MLVTCSLLFGCSLSIDALTIDIDVLSLHDALPISRRADDSRLARLVRHFTRRRRLAAADAAPERAPPRERTRLLRSEEHTSELQSLTNLVCRLLLEKQKHHPN